MYHNRKDRITEVKVAGANWTVETWWDGQSRNWITYVKDHEGYQVGWAEYVYLLKSAMKSHAEFVKDVEIMYAYWMETGDREFTSHRFADFARETIKMREVPTFKGEMTNNTAGEFWSLIYDVNAGYVDDPNDENRVWGEVSKYLMGEGVSVDVIPWKRRKVDTVIQIEGGRPDVMLMMAHELESWGDPGGGWDQEVMFRCRPFCRLASELRKHVDEHYHGEIEQPAFGATIGSLNYDFVSLVKKYSLTF